MRIDSGCSGSSQKQNIYFCEKLYIAINFTTHEPNAAGKPSGLKISTHHLIFNNNIFTTYLRRHVGTKFCNSQQNVSNSTIQTVCRFIRYTGVAKPGTEVIPHSLFRCHVGVVRSHAPAAT